MITQTVKIVRFHKIGGPEVLQLDELPLPEPGIGEVHRAAIFASSEEWVEQRRALKNLNSFVPEIIDRISGLMEVNESPPPKKK